jgi:hypothetical protein
MNASSPLHASALLDRHYLEVRARILEVAATLDRIERAEGNVLDDPRRAELEAAIELLLSAHPGRAEKVQRLFSRPYEAEWRREMDL